MPLIDICLILLCIGVLALRLITIIIIKIKYTILIVWNLK